MSFNNDVSGLRPRGPASPPQNGSTYLQVRCDRQSGAMWGTSQRLPPAHFRGGLIDEESS